MADAIRHTRLDAGIDVVTEPIDGSHSVTIGFWVDAGSRDEDPAVAGASHFLEHLLFKGTEERSAQEISEAVEAVGGEMNAFTTKEYTAFYVRLLDDSLELGLDILSDIMWAPAFRPEEVDAERKVILEEISMTEDEPSDLVHELAHDALFPGHPLGRPVLGTRSTISAMSREQIRSYFTSMYRPASMVVAASGNVRHDAIVEGVSRRLAAAPGDRPARSVSARPPLRPLAVITRPAEQAHMVVATRAISRSDPDRFALAVLNQILGGGTSSRLFQEVREKRGLAYSVYSYRSGYVEDGMLGIYVGTSPSRAHEVLDLVLGELDRMGGDAVTDRELEVARGHIKGSLALSLEDSAGRMNRLGRSQLIHGEIMSFDELVARTDAVTRGDLERVAERVFTAERSLAVVGPFEHDAFADRVA